MLWFISLVLVTLLIVRRWKIQRFVEFSKNIKCGIRSYPLIGHSYLFLGDAADRMSVLQRFGREALKNGGMTSLWLGDYFLMVTDAEDLEVILKTVLEKGGVMRFVKNITGNGLIFAPVAIWRPRRKVMAPTFSLQNLNNFVEVFARQSSITVKILKAVAGSSAVSVWNYFSTYSLDSVCETALGIKLNCQNNHEAPFLKSFVTCCNLMAARSLQPWLQPDAVYKLLPYHAQFQKNNAVVHDFVLKAIKSKQKSMEENPRDEKSSSINEMKSFLELLLEKSSDGQGFNTVEIFEETLVIVIAGTDTSAVAMSFAVSLMAKHPDVQEKLYQELYEVFGESDRLVTHADLPRLKYLDAVLKEILRLYPPVPLFVRLVSKNVKLPSGITLIEGCSVLVNVWAAHRNPLYWGDDAEQFRPERFIDTPLKHPAAFLAFSYGPRTCLGYQYAMLSMKTAVATVLRSYRVLNADEIKMNGAADHTQFKLRFDIMMKDVDGFKVKFEKRTKLSHAQDIPTKNVV